MKGDPKAAGPETGREQERAMRCSNPILLLVLPVAVALLLAAVPRDAEAQVCRFLKSKSEKIGKKECVVSSDIENESLRSTEVRDVADGTELRRRFHSLKAPEPGLVMVTASVRVDASGSNGPVSVRCILLPGKTARKPAAKKILESLNPAEGIGFASVVATKIYRVRKGFFKFKFSCAQIAGGGPVVFENLGVTARYAPTEY